ncbi:MAG: MgtC/SapB family protein [Acidimicrobiia bacterium]|nr:MgtC/SapB family protein [Acidimicrobiia bacterium]
MEHLGWLTIVARLAMAMALGACVGVERELADRTAGFRTHSLVALGAAAFGTMSLFDTSSPSRIAAQVVTGVGFLGAGAILREGINVKGMTTAAAIWAAAAVGLASGIGEYWVALVTTALTLVILGGFQFVDRRLQRIVAVVHLVCTTNEPNSLVADMESRRNVRISRVHREKAASRPAEVRMSVHTTRTAVPALLDELIKRDDVASVEWDD